MAKGGTTKTADQMNAERRMAKQRQAAVRRAKAQNEEIARNNYRVGFKFARNDNLPEVLERQKVENEKEENNSEQQDKTKEAMRHGAKVNQTINDWLDQADTSKMVVISPATQIQQQACKELIGWLKNNADKYAFTERGNDVIISKLAV